MKKTKISSNFGIWQSLMDSSIYFILAGLKYRGYSKEERWRRLCDCWRRDSEEHRLADLRIIRGLYGRRPKDKYQ